MRTEGLSVSDFARAVGVTDSTVYQWIARGKAPKHETDFFGHIKFEKSAVLTWLKANRVLPPADDMFGRRLARP